MSKYEVLHLGKVPDKETLPCSVCKETRTVEQEIIRWAEKILTAYQLSIKRQCCGFRPV